MFKRILASLLTLVLIATLLPSVAIAANTIPSGYTAISTAEELDLIRNNLSGKYILTADIDLTDALASGGSLYHDNGWIAIGYSTSGKSAFTGVIDGNGHTISGFQVSGSKGSAAFVYKNEGTIKNLTISGTSKACSSSHNGVFCVDNHGTIQNCHNMVEITSSISSTGTSNVGCIVGINRTDAVVEDCSNQVDINVTVSMGYRGSNMAAYAGGIVGQNHGTVRRCYNTGNISVVSRGKTSAFAGGIVGHGASNSLILDAYNAGDITTNKSDWTDFSNNSCAGGIMGAVYGSSVSGLQIKTCYNVGTITATGLYNVSRYCGSLAGHCSGTTFTNCYYLTGTAESATYSGNNVSGATEMTWNQMHAQAAFTGFDFENVWKMGTDAYTYPVLIVPCTHALDYVSANASSCTEDGNIEYWYCNICEKYYNSSSKSKELCENDVIIPSSHSYETTVVEPTCTEGGHITYTCFCGSMYEEELPPIGHNYVSVITPPHLHRKWFHYIHMRGLRRQL